ncbi:3-hydroxybutyryl-CoA dehydrogenase [Geoalkalibacter halelectricus]|uniref:3-hydroxybutyryl-CoA dehydrogenase n=1 Tax=Geoalkalibacter halelectricus TaxID=2847045 RepID=A0ABY5ZLH5_9BACT|nr:3-hydroxybutyryl-CoA dehydrogenase [Geoalkalibacter halelectricus]MDO3380296.1 3-hydroxybutyryl-CoA dehydrogenase [Geoalkalibacter halelectricus]UWZ79448.1 3-hydroxybutyryl-CoA dehydrogenase [Geoalkalibacter halelectricus]
MAIKTFMVIGAGQMGAGIAQVAAQAGMQVLLNDISAEAANKGLAGIGKILERNVAKGKMSAEEREAVLARIRPSTSLEDAAAADFIVEAATENLDIKTRIFQTLDRVARPEVILATNTSSLPITEIAAVTSRPAQVIGMHFMNPVPVMPLVEVIRGIATSDAVYACVDELARALGKTPVEVNDFPGFVSNRVLLPMINEAIYCVYEGVAMPEAVDAVMKLGMNHPMGPLTLADFIGLDTCLSIMEILHEGLGDSKYRPCPLLRKMVKAGWLGKKSGKGFYEYA